MKLLFRGCLFVPIWVFACFTGLAAVVVPVAVHSSRCMLLYVRVGAVPMSSRFGRTPLPLPEPTQAKVPLFKLIQFHSASKTASMVYTVQVHPYTLSDGGMECTTRFA